MQNLCYLGSVEEIVYGRLLDRLSGMLSVVGDQQVSLLPVTEDDFRRLASGEISEPELEAESRRRIALAQQRIRETELTGHEVYEIYQRLSQSQARDRYPITLEGIWDCLTTSAYLKGLGCTLAESLPDSRLMIRGVPGITEGTALTVDRALYDRGIESLGQNLRFATYGETAFDAILALGAAWKAPCCVRRIVARPVGLDHDYVGFVAAVRDGNRTELRLITALDELADRELDESVSVGDDEAQSFVIELQRLADQEFRLTTHAKQVEANNERSGKSQAALALGVAFGLIRGRQRLRQAEDNFWRELDACRRLVEERTSQSGALNIQGLPAVFELAMGGFVPFDVRAKIGDGTFWVNSAPLPLLNAALDAVARVADGIKKRRSDLTTDYVLERIEAEMRRTVL